MKEIAIATTIKTTLAENEYIANKPDQGKIVKHVSYYLATAEYTPLTLEKKGGLDDARWFLATDTASLRMYDDIRTIIEKGKSALQDF